MLARDSVAPRPDSVGDVQRCTLVLIADDNPVSRLLLSRYFLDLGIQTDLVKDGAQAVSSYLKGRYSLILMDLWMPGIDGLSAMRTIRAYERQNAQPDVPIVIVSASNDDDLKMECLQSGATAFLAKPVSFAALSKAIARCGLSTEIAQDESAQAS